jgi:hypothetical protein
VQAVAVLPGAFWAVPAAQSWQTLLLVEVWAADWNFPGAQVDAVLQLFWPMSSWYMPDAQAVHGVPAVAEYMPAAQAVHLPALRSYPAAQVSHLPSLRSYPAAQVAQDKLSAAQVAQLVTGQAAVHVLLSVLGSYPSAQVAQDKLSAAQVAQLVTGQVSQDVAPGVKAPAQAGQAVVPVPLWYVRAGQAVQAVAVLPGAFWAVPAAQS